MTVQLLQGILHHGNNLHPQSTDIKSFNDETRCWVILSVVFINYFTCMKISITILFPTVYLLVYFYSRRLSINL